MLQKEFETLTDIFPDTILYEVIEREYNRRTEDGKDFWDNKAQFCHAYKFNEDGLASRIQSAANEAIWRRDEAHRKAMTESSVLFEQLHKQIERLKKELEIEQEWKPAENIGTNLDQTLYEDLAASAADHLRDQEAIELISEMFGFMPERIEVIRAVSTYEKNRHSRLRVRETFAREPLYVSTDWNYVRFNCAGCQWEMIDGELMPYED